MHFCMDEARMLVYVFLTLFGLRKCVGMLKMNFPKRKAQRKVEAEARNEAYQKLPLTEKLKRNSKKVHKKLSSSES